MSTVPVPVPDYLRLEDAATAILSHENFGADDVAYCYRCKQFCRVHGPDGLDPNYCRVKAAGTTCTSWSQMNHSQGKQLVSKTALPFFVWALQTLASMPDLIIHECVASFDISILTVIFGAMYTICSTVFGPDDLGIPSSRTRRWTIMMRKDKLRETIPFAPDGFGRLFFRKCTLPGGVYWCAPVRLVESYIAFLANARFLPDVDVDGSTWQMERVLPNSLYQELLAYEKRGRIPSSWCCVPFFLICISFVWPRTIVFCVVLL